MKCSQCGRELENVEGQSFCGYCGARLDATQAEYSAETETGLDGAAADPRADRRFFPRRGGYCPWEDQERLGLLVALFRTIKETLFYPGDFFARLPVSNGYVSPLLYGMILGTLGAMVGSLWVLLFGDSEIVQAVRSTNLSIFAGVAIPVAVLLSLFVSAALMHGCLFLMGGAREGFEATFRVVCYSEATQLFNLVPSSLVSMVGMIWRLYILTVGLREVHGIGTGKAAAAVVLPLILTGVAVSLGFLFLFQTVKP